MLVFMDASRFVSVILDSDLCARHLTLFLFCSSKRLLHVRLSCKMLKKKELKDSKGLFERSVTEIY